MESTKPKRLTDLTAGDIAVLDRQATNHPSNMKYNDGKPKEQLERESAYRDARQSQQ